MRIARSMPFFDQIDVAIVDHDVDPQIGILLHERQQQRRQYTAAEADRCTHTQQPAHARGHERG
jgi:hypothetical protein